VFTARLLPLWWVAAGLSSGVLLALVLVFGRLQIDRGTRTVEVVLDDLPVTVQALVSVQNGDAAAARYRQAPSGMGARRRCAAAPCATP